MLIRHVQRATWIVGAILAALLFFTGGAAVRLLMGPISLGPFAGAIEDSLNRSVSGLVIRFDQAILEWSRAEGKINLIVLGTKVLDLDGRIIAQAPKADLDFDAGTLLSGHLSLKRFSLIGVQLTGVRAQDGTIRLGFSSGQGAPDILETIRGILENSEKGAGSLQSFAIRNARMAFSDEPSGLFIVSPDTTFTLQDIGGHLDASLDSSVEISGVPARVAIRAALRDNGAPEHGTLEVRGLSFPALVQNSAAFTMLKPYQLVSNLTASFALGDNGQILSTAFHFDGAGTIESPELRSPLAVDGFALQGSYTKEGNRLAVEAFEVKGKQISAKAKAALTLAWNDTSLFAISGDVTAQQVKLVFPALSKGPLTVSRVSFRGAYNFAENKLTWERGSLRDGALSADVSGSVIFAQGLSPALKLSGRIEDIAIRDLLRYWPETVAPGAHLWIDENIPDGRVGPIRVTADFPAGAFDANALPDEVLSMSFPFHGTTIRYMEDLTPLTGAEGDALLLGNTFHATVAKGDVGPVAMTNGDVLLQNIHTRGAPGLIKAHAAGEMQNVLQLIDQKPLGYPSRFGVEPASARGHAAVDLEFSIPMRRDVTLEEIGIGVEAKLSDLSMPLDQRRRLEAGALTMDLDANSLISQGTGKVSGVPVSFNWSESFASAGDSTRIDFAAVLDERSRPILGLYQPDWLKGAVPFTAILIGRRFHFTDAAIRADASDVVADFRLLNVQKKLGEPASVSAFLHFADNGAISVTDLAIAGESLELNGGFELDPGGKLVKASLSRLRAGANNDFALEVETMPSGGFAARIEGNSIDASRLFGETISGDLRKSPPPAPVAPADSSLRDALSLKAKLGKLVLRDTFYFRDVNFDVSFGANERLDGFTLDAAGPTKAKIAGHLTNANGARSLALDTDDAGAFIRGMTGFSSVSGGSLEARVSLPAAAAADRKGLKPEPAQYTGTVTLSNVVVTDQPFMARLFAAGSLDGASRLLKREGIAVSRFAAPFSLRDKLLTIHEGRFSGSAVGATFEGTLDRGTDKVDIGGTLVPVYGLNSVLGSVPVLGDLFVSKPGEGVFGLTYAMRGDLNEPTLIVNPLSVLTPGIFRRIFEFSTPKETPQAATQPAARTE